MNTLNYTGNTPPDNILNNPLGENSIFHVVDDVFSETAILESYTHRIIWCKSGLDVFKYYQSTSNEFTPKPNELIIFYEETSNSTSNLFGTACRVKMGVERKALMQKIYAKNKTIKVNGLDCNSLKSWSQTMSMWYTKLEASVLAGAVTLELQETSNYNTIINTIFGINNKLADWISNGVGALDDVKFTDKNYDYAIHGDKLEPIIPIHLYKTTYQFLTQGGPQPYDLVKQKGLEQLSSVVSNFDDFIFNIAQNVVAATPTLADDLVLATIIKVKQYLQEKLGAVLEKLFTKLKQFIEQVKTAIEKFIDKIEDNLLMLNAFLCGLVNGILSIVQAILSIVAIVVDNIPILEIEKASPTYLAKHQEKLEFIEDAIDLLTQNLEALFKGIISQIQTLQKELFKLVVEIWQTVKQYSKYFWAFFIGGVVFEVIVDAIIAFFTGGSSAFAKASAKISRLSNQLTQKSKTAVKGFGKAVAKNTADLFEYLKKELAELIQALNNGELIIYIRKKFFELIGEGNNVVSLSKKDLDKLFKIANINKRYSTSDLSSFTRTVKKLGLSIEDFKHFITTGSLLDMHPMYLKNEMEFFTKQLKRSFAKQPIKLIKGNYCKREFDINNCGGKIVSLNWENTKIAKEGIEIVKKHIDRFERNLANEKMLERLEGIFENKIDITDFDKRFYTHEIAEYRKYKALGIKEGIDDSYELWNNTHSAVLDEFKLFELDSNRNSILFHPETYNLID